MDGGIFISVWRRRSFERKDSYVSISSFSSDSCCQSNVMGGPVVTLAGILYVMQNEKKKKGSSFFE